MDINGDFIFFMAAAICQIVVGLIFMLRPSENKWGLAGGALFILNGGISVASAISSVSPESFPVTRNVTYLLDPLTSYAIMFLALVFPKPIKIFEGRVWILALIVGVAATSQFLSLLFNTDQAGNLYRFTTRDGGGWLGTFYVATIQELSWAVLLVRWSRAVVKGIDWQFGLMAAALAVRASHMAVLAVGVRINWVQKSTIYEGNFPYITWYIIVSFVPLIALVYALFICLAPQQQANRARQIYTTFLLLGIGEALFSMASLAGIAWTKAPFIYLDVLVLRPLLFWGSLYGLPSSRYWRITGASLFLALCAAAFVPSGLSALGEMQITGGPAWFLSIIFALGMIAASARFLFPLLREENWQTKDLQT